MLIFQLNMWLCCVIRTFCCFLGFFFMYNQDLIFLFFSCVRNLDEKWKEIAHLY